MAGASASFASVATGAVATVVDVATAVEAVAGVEGAAVDGLIGQGFLLNALDSECGLNVCGWLAGGGD
jgi:hypothetical protein